MFDLTAFKGVRLRGGFRIISVEFADEPMVDAARREAIARTAIVGPQIEITIRSGLDERELSVTLYHEILEAATIGSNDPPESVLELGEADFERIAYAMHEDLGSASPENLNRMLQQFGFRES